MGPVPSTEQEKKVVLTKQQLMNKLALKGMNRKARRNWFKKHHNEIETNQEATQ